MRAVSATTADLKYATNCVTRGCVDRSSGVVTCRFVSRLNFDNKAKSLIPLGGSSNLSRRRSRVRVPSAPPLPCGKRDTCSRPKRRLFVFLGAGDRIVDTWRVNRPAMSSTVRCLKAGERCLSRSDSSDEPVRTGCIAEGPFVPFLAPTHFLQRSRADYRHAPSWLRLPATSRPSWARRSSCWHVISRQPCSI